MVRILEFTIKSDMGFFKKPDINEGIYLTYNLLHKPALLGILGAIIGLSGYKKNEEFPEYYTKLKELKVGIKPVGDEKGVFKKTVISYSNTTGFASEESGGNLIVSEQTLLNPSFMVYLLLNLENDIDKQLYSYIKNQRSEYIPYMGKNDYYLWWDKESVKEYDFEKLDNIEEPLRISTVFKKDDFLLKDIKHKDSSFSMFDFSSVEEEEEETFAYFEKLPVGFDERLFQYTYADFVYSNFQLKPDCKINNLFKLDNKEIIYLF